MNNIEKVIDDSFKIVSDFSTGVSNIKGTSITPEMMKEARKRYAVILGDELRKKGYNEKGENNKFELGKKQEENKNEKSYVPTLKPKSMIPSINVQNRGFADIIVLAIIVLVYAAIIINLLLKLK